MVLRISASIVAFVAVLLFVLAWRIPTLRPRRFWRWATGGAVILAITFLVWSLVWQEPLTVYRRADVPATTLVFYQSADVQGEQVTHKVLHAIRGTDATEVWHVDLPGDSTIQMYQGQILIMSLGSPVGSLTALRPQDGHRLWQMNNLPQGSLFTLVGTTVYVKSVNAAKQWQVAAYSLTTQQPLWSTPLVLTGPAELAGQPNVLYLIGKDIAAVRPADGQVLWQHHLASALQTQGIAFPEQVVVSTPTTVRAYDATTGQMRWESETVPQGFNSLTSGSGMILGVTNDNRVIAWNVSTGMKAWQHFLLLNGVPSVVNAVAYITSVTDGNAHGSLVSAYDIVTGDELWHTPTTSADTTALLGPDVIANNSYEASDHQRPSLMFLDGATGHPRLTILASGQYTFWTTLYRVGNTLFVTANDTQPYCSFNCGSGPALLAYDIHNGQQAWALHAPVTGIVGTLDS